jgi:hypothetical protein
MGSNPVGVTTLGRLAQLGERLPYKQDVGSSILSSPTIEKNLILRDEVFVLVACGNGSNRVTVFVWE